MVTGAHPPEWHAARRTGIGGSDVAAILGLSRWKTPLSVYLDKIGEAPAQEDSEPMAWGRRLEPVIRDAYSAQTGRAVLQLDEPLRHKEHAHMIANLDGIVFDGLARRVLEIKTARTQYGWGEPGSDSVPIDYTLQVQHYMLVTGYALADVAVLIGGSDLRIYEIAADRELHEMLTEAEAEFWDRVQRREPPEPVSLSDSLALYGRSSTDRRVTASPAVRAAVERLRALKAQAADIAEKSSEAQAEICAEMRDAATLVDDAGEVLATWKASKGAARLDAAALREALPDVAAQYTVQSEPTRRFVLK